MSSADPTRSFASVLARRTPAALALAALLIAPPALAQGTPGGAEPESGTTSAPASGDATTDSATGQAGEGQAGAGEAGQGEAGQGQTEAEPSSGLAAASKVEPPREEWDNTDVTELPGKTYLFLGLRYRGNIVPKFMLNMFVEEGKTIYSNSIGAELDIRKDNFSLIPSLQYTEYGTGDILFKQKGTKDIPGNYSLVNSSLKAIYASADLLWSTKISKTLDFEYGAGFGLGVVFGGLVTNWVQQDDANGQLGASNGHRYAPCVTVGTPGTGCNKADHQNSSVDKVGNYKEPSWFSGGSKPVVFPLIAVPQIGLRFKPIKQFVARLGLGFSLTGFWFGLSADYGLEHKPAK